MWRHQLSGIYEGGGRMDSDLDIRGRNNRPPGGAGDAFPAVGKVRITECDRMNIIRIAAAKDEKQLPRRTR